MNILTSDRGFTLIEVVIAFGVLGLGILAMFSMQTYAIRGNHSANKITQKAVSGADSLEQILTHDFTDTVDQTEMPDLTAYLDPDDFTVAWSITEDSPLEDLATIEVTITSEVDGKEVTLQYIKADPDAF